MNYKLIAVGITGVFLLITCAAVVLLIGLTNHLLFTPDKQPQRIRQVNPVPPLVTLTTFTPQKVVSAPPGLITAALEESQANIGGSPTPAPTPTIVTSGPTITPSPIVTPIATPAQKGVATRLVIPKIELDRPVLFAPVENGTWQVGHLGQAVGHLEGTAPPGSDSNIVLAGHVTLSTGVLGPFARLSEVAPGDTLIVYEGDRKYLYLVESQRTVDRNDVAVVYPSETGQITLITCTTWNSQEGRYSNRLVVKGRLIKG